MLESFYFPALPLFLSTCERQKEPKCLQIFFYYKYSKIALSGIPEPVNYIHA